MAKLVGWREWVSLPNLGVERVKVKVDTGARTSAVHASDVEVFDRDGQEWVRFQLQPLQDNQHLRVACEEPVAEWRTIRDSGGHEERRIIIVTDIQVDDEVWPIELSLTDREHMGFRMLLGRRAIRNRFYVDPTQSFILSRPISEDYDHEEEEEEQDKH